jgi:hypothetical protein
MNTKGDYIPGTCNIGPAETKARRNVAIISGIISVGILLIFPLINADKILRLVLFFPATSAGIGFQQWYNHFCVSFGLKGVFNFGAIGKTFTVEQQENFKKDRSKAQKMILIGIAFGLIISILFYLV